ncbi:hypothetical protein ROS62_12500 [Streptomyces sp. DSM 41972]|uniref:DUF7691 domain-containing protein n=1 Tax=Streptomyces althioticus subsp. attaecolombicae TaxID=3075534 RepID=A0ABU3HYA8_9ACTN|nr:hypothetical protein [Streptomyces sp. DSM 41972]
MFPLARAKPAADAYRAVLDSVEQDFRGGVHEFVVLLEREHQEWGYAAKAVDRSAQDTIFSSVTG